MEASYILSNNVV